LSLEISEIKQFSNRLKALVRLSSALSDMTAEAELSKAPNFDAAKEMIQWIKTQVLEAVDTLPLETTEDGKGLLSMEWLGADAEMLLQRYFDDRN
jgi:phage host-nuclease inhibitor protein Gam